MEIPKHVRSTQYKFR